MWIPIFCPFIYYLLLFNFDQRFILDFKFTEEDYNRLKIFIFILRLPVTDTQTVRNWMTCWQLDSQSIRFMKCSWKMLVCINAWSCRSVQILFACLSCVKLNDNCWTKFQLVNCIPFVNSHHHHHQKQCRHQISPSTDTGPGHLILASVIGCLTSCPALASAYLPFFCCSVIASNMSLIWSINRSCHVHVHTY